jgi:uncharacterized metal-binding protein YceD (DUF177 family)
MIAAHAPPPEFSRPLAVERISAAGYDVTVEANQAERAALAPRLKLPTVGALICRFRLRQTPDGAITAEGWLDALVTQTCVVSLDDFVAPVSDHFHIRFVPEGLETDDLDPESEDEIPYTHGTIDLGEIATEQLALALDPWPRKPDATLPDHETDTPTSPFATLAPKRLPT